MEGSVNYIPHSLLWAETSSLRAKDRADVLKNHAVDMRIVAVGIVLTTAVNIYLLRIFNIRIFYFLSDRLILIDVYLTENLRWKI